MCKKYLTSSLIHLLCHSRRPTEPRHCSFLTGLACRPGTVTYINSPAHNEYPVNVSKRGDVTLAVVAAAAGSRAIVKTDPALGSVWRAVSTRRTATLSKPS